MSYLDKHLSADEKIIYKCRTSRLSFLGEYALLAFVVIISITSLFTTFMSRIENYNVLGAITIILFYMFSILALILLVRVEYKIWSKRYALTSKRVIISEGIFTERFKSAVYDKITDIGLNQSFMDKILNIGTVTVDTAGGDDIEITFVKVSKPFFIKNKISEMQTSMKGVSGETERKPTRVRQRR